MGVSGKGRRLAVAVIAGGPSSEAEISRSSARAIEAALKERGHRAVRLELDVYIAETLRSTGFEVAFPIAHGLLGEDGALQGLLECLAVPYVGSGVLASGLAMNKAEAKRRLHAEGLPVAAGFEVHTGARLDEAIRRACNMYPGGYVVKPKSGGSAIGVIVDEMAGGGSDAERGLTEALTLGGGTALIEAMARGVELTCAVLENNGTPHPLPLVQVQTPEDAFYTYEARYAPGRSVHLCPAPLAKHVGDRIGQISVCAHRALGCRDLSRVDFILTADEAPILLEVNTLPGFTPTSLFPEAAREAGWTLPALCDHLVQTAYARGPRVGFAACPFPV